MHTARVIAGGLVLLGLFTLARQWCDGTAGALIGIGLFIPVWFALALANMWVGVTRAGYTVAQEFPVLVAVFAGPAGVAAILAWQFVKG